MSEIYLDYNATTPVAKPVRQAVDSAMKYLWGNPSSGHGFGRRAKEALESARTQVARLLNADHSEIIFTSGGTESNNAVILGVCRAMSHNGRHLVTTRIEHPSLMNPCLHLLEQGWNVSFIKVNGHGIVDPKEVERALRPDTVLISVMLANNETGAMQPVAAISQLARKHGVLVHTDAAQAAGKILVDVKSLGVDYLSIAGHKLYAPKGIGALYCRKGVPVGKLMFGAGQEQGHRPGTEPVPMAVGLAAACDFVAQDIEAEAKRLKTLRERLYAELSKPGRPMVRHCNPDDTLPNTLSVSFVNQNGTEILAKAPKVMASTGAACHDRDVKVSYVLAAMGVSPKVAMGTIRFTLGHWTTESDIEIAAQAISRALE